MRLLANILGVVRRMRQRPASAAGPLSAATIDLGDPAIARDPYLWYEHLRREGPVQFLQQHDVWIVLGYEEVHFAFTHPKLFSNSPYSEVDAVLLGADPPEHGSVRRIVMNYFSPESLETLRAFAQEHARRLIKPRMDAVSDYALPLSEAVAARLLGLDDAAVQAIRAAHAQSPELAPYTKALDTIADRAAIFDSLRADGLGEAEARSLVRLLWLAATTTTERVITRCIALLLERPDLRRALGHDPSLVRPFTEEVLRLHPPEHMVPRLALADVELGGATIPKGALVYLCVAAANRDPSKFDGSQELRIDRPPMKHFSFGTGIHHCIGAALGREEIAIAVRTLLEVAPHFRAAATSQPLEGWCTMTANPIHSLVLDTGNLAP